MIPFPQCAGTAIAIVVVLNVAPPDHLHGFADAVFIVRCQQQMHVIRHQHISMQIAMVFLASRLQLFQIKPVIRFSAKYFRAVVASHNDMLRMPRNNEPR